MPVEKEPTTGKDKFFSRLAAEFVECGVGVVGNPHLPHDVYLDRIRFRWQSKAPKILRLNGVYINKDKPHRQPNKEIRHWAKKANAIIYQSEFCRKMNEKYTTYKLNVPSQVIFNGAPLAGPRDITPAKKVFVACARWRPHKRLSDTKKAFALAAMPNTELRVVGEKEHESDAAVRGALQNAQCLVYPAWLDWCPNTVVESLALGTPVLSGNSGGTPELIEFGCGAIVQLDQPYGGEMVHLYDPPKIDHSVLAAAMWGALEWPRVLPENREHVNIQHIAADYLRLMEDVCR